MFVDDIVKGFYDIISKNKILILVNYDVDAICAVKILQCILRFDNIIYILVPVKTLTELKREYDEQKADVKHVILINCGGTSDIVEILQPEDNVIFFIVDSHRPTDVCNIYSSSQIRILAPPEDDEKIPEFEYIFNEDESSEEETFSDYPKDDDDDDDDASIEEQQNKRRKLDQSVLLRRKEIRKWEENRKKLLFDYSQFSYYGRSSAMLMFDLAWKLHRESIDLLWWGIVGVTEQYILGKTERMRYLKEVEVIGGHIGRICESTLNHENKENISKSSVTKPINFSAQLRIESDKDLLLALYRHWTIESSLRYSMFTAVSLKLWTIKGEKRLQQILAEMGLPLSESRQMFYSMDLSLRKQFYGFKTKYQCADYVYSMVATLETNTCEISTIKCFYNTLDSLSRSKKDLLDQGIEKAKWILTNMFRHVQAALDMKQIVSAGPFYYFIVQEGTLHSQHYSNPHCLTMLATFALRAQVASVRKAKATRLPLIASATLNSSEETCLVAGIPPITETMPKSFFGKAFEQAANKTNIELTLDYFDSSIAKLKIRDRPRFFDALSALLS
ncbi:cell division control protein 45 homolog isoform X2 [Adelges cooleyi]|uniref:cell division control protein 45 homolog isoform X2 n=1 Tax=Adelges cooleyi TaxID=133065 RepID=UPI00217F47B6|nr:cell division control protein 45 homolog isoform X2 [Adelges cooleyi]